MDNTKFIARSKMQNSQQDAPCQAYRLMPAEFMCTVGSSPVCRRECLVFAVKDSVSPAHGLVPMSLCDYQPCKGLCRG